MGTRDSRTVTDSTHFVAGWSLNSTLTCSRNKIEDQCAGDYAKGKEYPRHVGQSLLDPFAAIGGQSDAIKTLIANSLFHGSIREASTTSRAPTCARRMSCSPLARSGTAGVGSDYRQYHYEQTPLAKNPTTSTLWRPSTRSVTAMVFSLTRSPRWSSSSISPGPRLYSTDAIENGIANTSMRKKASKTTYKISACYRPTQAAALRGSFGTSFETQSMLDIGQPLANAGFTVCFLYLSHRRAE